VLISVLNQKGGVGKSTTAVHLARWLQLQDRAVHLADLDPQQSSSFWLQAAEEFTVPCTVVPADAGAALDQLPALAAGCDVLIVDGPAGLSDATRAVMLVADLEVQGTQLRKVEGGSPAHHTCELRPPFIYTPPRGLPEENFPPPWASQKDNLGAFNVDF
jgi:cellulose biosynthesis protein BcsQ